jgi:hypothetical protein
MVRLNGQMIDHRSGRRVFIKATVEGHPAEAFDAKEAFIVCGGSQG